MREDVPGSLTASARPASPAFVRVAVPVPALDALTYRVPPEFAVPAVGARVLVPLGSRVITGVVLDAAAEPDARAPGRDGAAVRGAPAEDGTPETPAVFKDVIDVLDAEPYLPDEVLGLARWVAEYYACGVGDAIAATMPPRAWIESERHVRITDLGHARLLAERGVRRELLERLASDRTERVESVVGSRRGAHAALTALAREGLITISRPLVGAASAFRTVRVARITAQGLDAATSLAGEAGGRGGEGALKLGPRQQEVLASLAGAPEGLETRELAAQGIPAATLARLARLGLIALVRRRVERDPFPHAVPPVPTGTGAPRALTSEQDAALRELGPLAASGAFGVALLHGVTGSGKTELYLRLTADAVRAERRVLILVPEIALTPAVAGTFRATFADRVAIQHSGLSDGERHDQWHRIRRGEVDVVIGTRSAVFAPLPRLGLVIVDEEHDGSYKQEETPRYHGRDVAIVRAQRARALVVLGSATPSLESYYNARNGRYALIALQKRVHDRPMAAVRLVDMRAEYAEHGPDVIVSSPLADAIRERLDRREQAMILLNRRGYATSVFCRQCGTTLECPNCSVTLTIHRAARRARCHYCNHSERIPTTCVQCGGTFLEQAGFGTERVEAEVSSLCPEARVARVDRDTIRRRGAISGLLQRFAAGELDVLVGTQMIAKGHDFPQVTLVGVISADVGLGLADFRAAERTFQLLTQVAGRAGRGDIRGEAIVQSIHPDHYSIRHACRQDYDAFYRDEVNFRRSMHYPPVVALVNAVVRAGSLDAALADAGEIVSALRWGGEQYRVLGPAPAPLSKIKGEHRAQLFIKGTHRTAMRRALLSVLGARPDIRRRTVVDVDPMSVL